MTWYALVVFVHLFSAVLLTGSVLFWVVMASQLGRRFDDQATDLHLELINEGRWPPVAVPERLRFSLAGWGGGFVVVLLISGVLLLEHLVSNPEMGFAGEPFGSFFDKTLHVKLLFTGMLVSGLLILARQPRAWVIYLNAVSTLIIVVLSALLES